MDVSDYSYQGFYARFDTPSKNVGSLLMGPDNIVGDDFKLFFKTDNGLITAWIKNKFDKDIGYFDVNASRKLQLANARDLSIRILLSFVAYSDNPDPGCYWGEMAVFCFNPAYSDEFNSFIDRCAIKIGDGVRPNIDFGSQSINKVLTEKDWLPKETVPLPKKETGFAVLKDHRSLSEKMIEQGRSKNIGCYVISWAFIIVAILAIVYGIHLLGVF